MRKKLKLYVWEDVLTDWTSGVMFALATSPENARKAIHKKHGYVSDTVCRDLKAEPKVVESVEGFVVWGGG